MNLEHKAWRGGFYESGWNDYKVCIVGHSHYLDEKDTDSELLTIDIMQEVILNDRYAYFRKIRAAFGAVSVDFWHHVLFFNYLPWAIGTRAEMRKEPSRLEIGRARTRFVELLSEHRPDKVFAFSTRGWRIFPEAIEEPHKEREAGLRKIGPPTENWNCGTYAVQGKIIPAYGLRHTDNAKPEQLAQLRSTVQTCMKEQLPDGAA